MNDYECFKARMVAWEARAKMVARGRRRGLPKPRKRPQRSQYEAERKALTAARGRCFNPRDRAYKHYGARGIRVCREWCGRRGFKRFLAHIGPRPGPEYTLDRIDNDRGYEPGNVRWATRIEQANNKRTTRWITWRNERHTAAEWARLLGVRANEILRRADAARPLDEYMHNRKTA